MECVIPEFTLKGCGLTLEFPGARFAQGDTIAIQGDNWDITRAIAFAAFPFPADALAETGYRVVGSLSRSEVHGRNVQFIPSNVWAAISGYWNTVEREITMDGTLLVSEGRAEALMEVLQLGQFVKRPPGELSGGETAKMIVAAHLLRQPDVVVLDRVLEHFDADARNWFIKEMKSGHYCGLLVTIGDSVFYQADNLWTVLDGQVIVERGPLIPLERSIQDSLCTDHKLTISTQSCGCNDTPVARLAIHDLRVQRNGRELLAIDDLEIHAGTITWLLGPNGSGKTTFFEACVGWYPLTSGRIIYYSGSRACDVTAVVAYSPQVPGPDVTESSLLREVQLSRSSVKGESAEESGNWLLRLGLDRQEIDARLADDTALQKLASVLSALSRGRKFCLLDEPTAALSHRMKGAVQMAIIDYIKRGGVVICATHDGSFYQSICASLP